MAGMPAEEMRVVGGNKTSMLMSFSMARNRWSVPLPFGVNMEARDM